MNPFHFKPGTLLSVSGGRTSGYVLRRTIDENCGCLPKGVIPAFANTGKEFPETLDFVHAMEQEWDCPIYWVEYIPEAPGFKVVDYATASRNGGPFEALINKKKHLPNSAMRFCTEELKVKTLAALMASLGYADYTTVLGIRADEPRRVAKIRARIDAGEDIRLPLVEAGIGEAEIFDFWRNHPFTVQLPEGISNCDNCFLKGLRRVEYNLRQKPQSGEWWARMEAERGATFNKRISFAQLAERAEQWRNHPALPLFGEEEAQIACFCTD
jgi:hypothetical protein